MRRACVIPGLVAFPIGCRACDRTKGPSKAGDVRKKKTVIKSSKSAQAARAHLRPAVGILVLLAGIAAWKTASTHLPNASPVVAASTPVPPPPTANFITTIPNTVRAPDSAPGGMAWIPGGEFSMGAQDAPDMNDVGMSATTDSRPVHRVYVDGFWMDKTDVTNEEFAKFVKATSYVTIAERKPRAEDFPGAPPENLVAGSVVFSPPDHAVPLNDHFQWWSYVKGANWRHPLGPQSDIKGKEKYPVVHVALEDAVAYAKWAGKRLSTEAEWEFAARGGLSGKPFVWGDQFRPNGKWMANTFQGKFPVKGTDKGEDGTATASTTWPATFGSGPATGTARIITRGWSPSGAWRETRRARILPLIHLSQQKRKRFTAAGPSFVPINTARATSLARAVKAKSARQPTISGFAA